MSEQSINRRDFLKKSAQGAGGVIGASVLGKALLGFPSIKNKKLAGKTFVLGIDGMDPVLLRRFVRQGGMPTFKKFMESNYFGPLQTTMPPQSPVAWASFITGTNPGGHGIFDFIHREPKTLAPFLSTSRSYGTEKSMRIGNWSIPLKGGKVENLRGGPAFWTVLEENDIPVSLFKLPANFPVIPSKARVISGMGTPDLLGTQGTFTLFTDMNIPGAESMGGGRVVKVEPKDHVIRTRLPGPENTYRTDRRETEIAFTVHRDPQESVIKISIQGHELLLKQGEWTDWIPLKFELMPLVASIHGMVRIYVQQVHPHFRLYFTPINIDPMEPDLPISSPPDYSRTIAESVGRFYTQGFPEDTKTLTHNIFSDDEFLAQSTLVLEERLKAFHHELNRFNEGLFFFYFSSVDQNSHMLLRTMDPTHPLYDPQAHPEVKNAIYSFYRSMDNVLRETLSKMDDDSVIMILSDHGFAPFTREFHLSTWLVENGYTAITDRDKVYESEYFDYVDWSRTQAYAYGLNGLYLNRYGRESDGAVFPQEVPGLKKEIIEKLSAIKDPINGRKIIARAYDSQKLYSGPYTEKAPDIVIGYQSHYRISDEAALGKFPQGILGNRTDKWSSDHCIDPSIVPGVLLTNLDVKAKSPGLWDMAPSIIKGYGQKIPGEMTGKPITT